MFFKKKPTSVGLEVDVHSHLIPGIDDGSQSVEQTLEMLELMQEMGYKKVITTPHIISDLFPNTPARILEEFESLKAQLKKTNIKIELEIAAEHYLDEFAMKALKNGEVLTFGEGYLLFETSLMSKPVVLEEYIFEAISKGLKPVLAHPERYLYFQNNWELLTEISNRGALFQLNISSLGGFYSKPAKTLAERLIDEGLVHFLGTDAHNVEHLEKCKQVLEGKYAKKATSLPLLNKQLL